MTAIFNGKHVVVTGGTGALGGAVVGMLLDRGATCHVPCMVERELQRFAHGDNSRARVKKGVDLRDEVSTSAFYTSLPALWASIHIAGGFAMGPIEETSLADWRAMLDMNATTCFLCCREAVKRIRATSDTGGRIVNVAAKPALVPTGGMVAYAASKTAVANITVSLAEEVKGDNIWVNAVVPSIMDTPANRAAMPDANFAAWPSVEAVAATIVFLASPDNRATRGALAPVYGAS